MAESEVILQSAQTGTPEEVANYEGALYWRNLDDGRVIVLYEMLYTVRVCIGRQMDTGYDNAWCYPKRSVGLALLAVALWDGNGDPPDGWIKQVGTGRRRADGDPAKEYVAQ